MTAGVMPVALMIASRWGIMWLETPTARVFDFGRLVMAFKNQNCELRFGENGLIFTSPSFNNGNIIVNVSFATLHAAFLGNGIVSSARFESNREMNKIKL